MTTVIPLRADFPAYTETVEFGGGVFRVRVRWNSRVRAWYVDLLTSPDEDVILAGRKLTSNWSPFKRFRDTRLPEGELIVVVLEEFPKPGREDLGVTAQLIFVPEEEIS